MTDARAFKRFQWDSKLVESLKVNVLKIQSSKHEMCMVFLIFKTFVGCRMAVNSNYFIAYSLWGKFKS